MDKITLTIDLIGKMIGTILFLLNIIRYLKNGKQPSRMEIMVVLVLLL